MTIKQSSEMLCDACGFRVPYESSIEEPFGAGQWWYALQDNIRTAQYQYEKVPFHVCGKCAEVLVEVLSWIGIGIDRVHPKAELVGTKIAFCAPLIGEFAIGPLEFKSFAPSPPD